MSQRSWAIVGLLAACGAESLPAPAARAALLELEGELDPTNGTLRLWRTQASALTAVPVDRDGVAGTGAAETVELVTTSIGRGVAGCGQPQTFCGDVVLRSFASDWLLDAYVELTALVPTRGHEVVNSSPPALGASAAIGLWSYGAIGPRGANGSSASRRWIFRDLDGSPFRFRGRVLAERAPGPKNIILVIGDGMGAAQALAARMFANGDTAPLRFESFPERASMATVNAGGLVTDSAAAATAIATGVKVDNGVVSVRTPGDGAPLATALELQRDRRRRTGLVTTSAAITDATPAAFGAHEARRTRQARIAADYLQDSRPNVLFGLVGPGMTPATAAAAGYAVVTDAAGMGALDLSTTTHVSGQFATATPPLADMTAFAIDLLSRAENGFFLMVEHEATDSCGHANDLACVIDAVLELDAAVAVAADFAALRDDTLVIVTGDHETGGLTVTEMAPTAGVVPAHRFTHTSHTTALVPVYAFGRDAARVRGVDDNTLLFPILAGQ